MYYAHTSDPKRGILNPQPYEQHSRNVETYSKDYAEAAFAKHKDKDKVILHVGAAGAGHDIGKLAEPNRIVLESESKDRLPIPHVNAGVAAMNSRKLTVAAMLTQSHHACLPNFLRNPRPRNVPESGWFEYQEFHELLDIHEKLVGTIPTGVENWVPDQMSYRMMLSCLVDADQHDTSRFYRSEATKSDINPLQINNTKWKNREWGKRLDKLMEEMSKKSDNADISSPEKKERQRLRDLNLAVCLAADTVLGFRDCKSPVGTGKTDSCLAHALKVADANNMARIIWITPLTMLVDQVTVELKKVLLTGDEKDTIAAVHHKSDYGGTWSRRFSQTFNSYLVAATAANCFDSFAFKTTSSGRKLHRFANSVIIIDESHMSLPVKLWRLSWKWLRILVKDFGCHVILSSGTQTSFWNIIDSKDVFGGIRTGIIHPDDAVNVRPLLNEDEMKQMREMEAKRVKIIPFTGLPMNLPRFAKWAISKSKGSTVIVCNTIRTATFLAEHFRRELKETGIPVIYVSNTLCPDDLAEKFKAISGYLKSGIKFFVIGTSLVEVGWDVSFTTGFRERSSLLSIHQLAGRVNRGFEASDAVIYDFVLVDGGEVSSNPSLINDIHVTGEMFNEGKLDVKYCDEYLIRVHDRMLNVANQNVDQRLGRPLYIAENLYQFKAVADNFSVIEAQQRTVIVDSVIADKLRNWKKDDRIDVQEIVNKSVRIDMERVDRLGLEAFIQPLFPDEAGNKMLDNLFVLNPIAYDNEHGYYRLLVANALVVANP